MGKAVQNRFYSVLLQLGGTDLSRELVSLSNKTWTSRDLWPRSRWALVDGNYQAGNVRSERRLWSRRPSRTLAAGGPGDQVPGLEGEESDQVSGAQLQRAGALSN